MRFMDWRRQRRDRKRPARHPLLILLDGRFWARHEKPFAKTKDGYARRTERRFVAHMKHRM